MIKKERKRGIVILFFYISVSEPPHFRRLRLRLLVNCKAENYEFVTTKKKYFLPWYKITEFTCSTLGTTFCIREENRVLDPHFFADPDPDPWGIRGRGVGGGGKGKKWFFFSFFFTFQMILNIAHLLLYKIMIYSFLSLPFWPGSGSANLCGSGSETLEENNFF